MKNINKLTDSELLNFYEKSYKEHSSLKKEKLSFNIARGKPSPEQLELVERLLTLPGENGWLGSNGVDCRNYGGDRSLPEAQSMMASFLGAQPENTIVEGSSSLALMHDHLVFSLLKGNVDSPRPWCFEDKIRFICPVPGYDYHFNMSEEHGIEMIPVEMDDNGPDMDAVEELVINDSSIKGMWCVPKYSNPSGAIYSDEVIKRLANMKAASPDFRIFWDNAYSAHHLTNEKIEISNIIEACRDAGNANRPLAFSSTSKVTFPGGGMAAFSSSKSNVEWFLEKISKRCIIPDRINQLRHIKLLPNSSELDKLMEAHRKIISPKFDAVLNIFDRELAYPELAKWSRPKGGYFISLNTENGCAKRSINLANLIGIEMTPAGSSFPYGKDPYDSHIRIAPTFLPLEQVKKAAQGIACSIRLAVSEYHLKKRSLL